MTPSQRLGKTIRSLRKEKGYSQEELADRCGIHRTYLGQIERGIGNPSLALIISIATQLENSAAELLEEAGL